MEYKRLPFEDYFTICSENWNNIDTNLELANYDSIIYLYKKKLYSAEYQVRFDEARNCIQVIMQQTATKSDWFANFNFPAKIYDKFTWDNKVIQLKVHRGWGTMWLACQETIRVEVKKLLDLHSNCFIEVFGWSLGSALASLAAEDIYFKFKIKPYLYTFGSVKPFFGKASYKFVKSCCAAAYNFKFKEDIVGYLVPLFGWRSINSIKLKANKHFNIFCLFKPQKYHCIYHDPKYYKDIK